VDYKIKKGENDLSFILPRKDSDLLLKEDDKKQDKVNFDFGILTEMACMPPSTREQVKDKIILFITSSKMTINDTKIIFQELLDWITELPNKIQVEEIVKNHNYQTKEYQQLILNTELKQLESYTNHMNQLYDKKENK
jgi:hypothetical protein